MIGSLTGLDRSLVVCDHHWVMATATSKFRLLISFRGRPLKRSAANGPNVGRDPAILVKQDMLRESMRGALDAAALL
ncbi:MAG: hypothetical protein NTW75_03780 [Planctomycetales bacterium]|nr:hypothetical protein [Planctomycetales bacterium]